MPMSRKSGKPKQPNRRRRASFPQLNPNPIVGVDSSGHITYLNTGAAGVLESMGKDASPDVFLPKDMGEILAALKRRKRATFRREVTVGGRVFDESIYVAPEHRAVGVYGTDITERKRTEEETARLMLELSRRKEELEQLIYVATHDLRTPLVGVQGFVSELRIAVVELMKVMREPGIPPSVRERTIALAEKDIPESLKYVETGVTRMSALLSGLLRLARLDRAAFRVERLDVRRLVGEVVLSLEFAAKKAGAKVEVFDLPPCVGDPVQVGQVFANLIENAFKYRSPDRKPVVKVSGRRRGAMSVYCIEDNGIGIAPELHAKVFELFYRVAPAQNSGDGLGLTIVKRIADRLGGKVWVESEPGKGARFFFTLPASRPAA